MSDRVDPPRRALADLDRGAPPLRRAAHIGALAAAVGFDWPDIGGVLAKIDEELAELRAALGGGDPSAVEAEIGDVLFSVVNLCRHVAVDPEAALGRTITEFERRFRAVEDGLRADGRGFADEGVDALEARWQAAKRR